jgi:predicted GNAT family N-acyltransferase
MIKIVSKKTHDLKKSEIMDIIKLKETYWKYGIKSQKEWFKKYVSAQDIHNMVSFNNEFIGYTLLRPRKIISKKYKRYLYFDTLILKKKFRDKKYSSNLMDFNNKIIKKNKKISFLITLKKLEKYYTKHGWKTLSKKSFGICDHKSDNIGMIYNNFKKLNNFKFYLYE